MLAPPLAWAKAKTRIFPLPMYTTVPTEGSTFGVMPVFVRTAADEEKVQSISAPSLSWNKHAGLTGTYRYYRYFHTLGLWWFIASASTAINRSLWFQYDDNRREQEQRTLNVVFRVRRYMFYRFFGLGPDTTPADESSYTRLFGVASVRWGWNFNRDINVGGFAEARGDWPERHALEGLPATQDLHAGTPGLGGAALLRQGLSIRYDMREDGDYSIIGISSELSASVAEELTGAGVFGEIIWHNRLLIPETTFLQLAARTYWWQLLGGGDDIPFYYQPTLGGELLMRGFPQDRFIDKGAWEIEVEQRIKLFTTHMFGVVADWRVDPFVAVGQVYGRESPWSHVRAAAGLGLRMWVYPNVLGRVDFAYGGEGVRAYVVLGYPY